MASSAVLPADLAAAFRLAALLPDGTSFYSSRNESRQRILRVDGAGRLSGYASIPMPEGYPGTRFWTFVDTRGRIWKNVFERDFMELVGYAWE